MNDTILLANVITGKNHVENSVVIGCKWLDKD